MQQMAKGKERSFCPKGLKLRQEQRNEKRQLQSSAGPMGDRGRLKINVVQHKMTKRQIKSASQGEINELYIPGALKK